jgi:hypothetical protein
MTVRELLKLLKDENPDSEVLAWVSNKKGYALVDLGIDDISVGYMAEEYPFKNKFIVIPVDVDVPFESWDTLDKKNLN